LGEFDLSMTFALGAGSLFDVSKKSEYVETLVGMLDDQSNFFLLLRKKKKFN
jgi:hypothetical protein